MRTTVAKNHTLPNGQSFTLFQKLDTPRGTFYLAPEFKDQQTKTAVGCGA
jgi:hypothetical protein